MNNLDDQIRDYYQKQKLDEHRVDANLDLGRQFSSVSRLKRKSMLALAPAAAIVITAYFAIPRDYRSSS